MKLCRFKDRNERIGIGLIEGERDLLDLTQAGVNRLEPLLESADLAAECARMIQSDLPRRSLADVDLLAPAELQEVWAAGVTYLRSKTARMEESNFSATAYDRVYEAERPELFFKCLPEKIVSAGEPLGIRRDARWSVPEPELALVLNSRGQIAGYTIGNDMSSRDIEGENLLYLPQAKIYHRSCALGPWILIGASEAVARRWAITLRLHRKGACVFEGETSVNQLKRSFAELAAFLFRSQVFSHGAILLTGTGVVPPDDFKLEVGDEIDICISGIGSLRNPVIEV